MRDGISPYDGEGEDSETRQFLQRMYNINTYYYACYDENRLKMCQMFFPLLLHPSDWPVSHAKKGVGDKGGGAEGKTRRMTMTTSLIL
jgi:hypothetical protein